MKPTQADFNVKSATINDEEKKAYYQQLQQDISKSNIINNLLTDSQHLIQ